MDAATLQALGQEVVYTQWFAWIDIVDDPLRAVSGVQDIAFAPGDTGDPDLDGHTFRAIPSDLIDVSDVQHSETGSETVTARLSALPIENADLLDILVRFNAFTSIERIDQPYLSSGQAQVLALITAVRNAKEGSLILVDEPEISLHIDWQERLVEQLHAPLTGSRLIIATHSPDIVVKHRHLCSVLKSKEEGNFYRDE